jgi:Predicted hydrolases of HD superfamily
MQPAVDGDRLRGIIDFIQAAERLKDTLRSGRTSGGRAESSAEHSWRLCLLVMLFEKELAGCDLLRLLKLCIVHDLGEAISGDIPAIVQRGDDGKAVRERAAMAQLCAPLPADLRQDILALWDEYDAAATPEAILAKGFDKLETMLQHTVGRNPAGFDYAFNLAYGLQHTARHPLLSQIRAMVDEATRARMRMARHHPDA